MMNARKRAQLAQACLLHTRLFVLVSLGKLRRHRCEIDTVIGIGRIFEINIPELLQQKRHALETVATMAVTAVGQESHHGLIDLHATWRLWPVR